MKINEVIQNIKVWTTWANSYKKYVPGFIEEAKTKTNWQDWDKDIFREYFDQSRDQCVSSLQQGYYTNIEKDAIKKNWGELAVLLKKIADQQDQMDLVTYDEIKKWLRKHTSQNRKAAANRLIASLQPNLLCTIVNEGSLRTLMYKINELDNNTQLKISSNWFENSNRTLNYFKGILSHKEVYDIMTYPWQTFEILTKKETNLNSNEMSETEDKTSKIKSLLEYKKQIILQGPPGTGKTREAKLIAQSILGLNEIVEINIFREALKFIKKIPATNNNNSFYIDSFNNDIINFKESTSYEKFSYSLTELYDCYISNDYLKEDFVKYPQYSKRCSVLYILDRYVKEIMSEQFKLIQFHPSYTYEDFVRGIVSKTNENGDGIVFTAENKILGKFIEKALNNLNDTKKGITELSLEKWLNEQFDKFIFYITEKIEKEEKIELTESVFIVELDEDAFRYKGLKGWNKKGNRMLFKDIKQAYLDENFERQDIKHNQNLSGLAKWHASYYIRVLDMFKTYLKDNKLIHKLNPSEKEKLKNYVLIIDEINRANLSSVLGELIYALEYRGETVESMYDVNGNDLILPQNLYIIGTMNTADRSVGHIDYAIRRRFAFVDVLPKDLSNEEVVFDNQLFLAVKSLFTTDDYKTHSVNLSKEFDPKDVALGHSYFIQQYEKDEKGKEDKTKPIDFQMRLEYEIKPILLEYVKDGILIGNDIIDKIEQLETSI